MKNVNRRDFLKYAASLSVAGLGSRFIRLMQADRVQDIKKKNVLVVVFDALSALHIPLYGYSRETAPNLSRLAERAIVYHNHYAGGNFTTPGTASLLTGTLPWKHRAFGFYRDVVESLADKSMFHAFDDYYRIAYSHNPLAVKLLDQFSSGLTDLIPLSQFLLVNDSLVDALFSKDGDIASVAWQRTIKSEDGYSYSLFLSELYKYYQSTKVESLKAEFPRGLPSIRADNYFTLEMVTDWLKTQVNRFPRPFLGYFHFLPPHFPYATEREFYDQFLNDRFSTAAKPEDVFSEGTAQDLTLRRRRQYDEFILYLDREFGKLFDHLEETGVLEDTWVVLTSDHGELFERGIVGHVTPVLYEPVVHVPLLIFEPGRTARLDIRAKTSAVDLLPTLLHVTGGTAADWTEGRVLPPFGRDDQEIERSIYTLQAKDNESDLALTKFTIISIRDNHKLMYFTGYKELDGRERIELYDLDQDPDELNNLYAPDSMVGKLMLEELKAKLAEINAPYL